MKSVLAAALAVTAVGTAQAFWPFKATAMKLGEAHIGNNSIFYLPEESWSISMYLKDFFVNSDGLVDNNWYDFWVSAKFAGPDYVAGSTKTNGVYINRMIMRRTPKEQAR